MCNRFGGGYESLRLICRFAVPLFFITSGFLFFGRLRGASTKEQNKSLRKFLCRGLRLYISWMVLLLPFTIYYRQWFKMGVLKVVVSFATNLLFGSTFIASWYLMALLIGTMIIAVTSRKLSNTTLFALSFVIYLVCCAWSGYGNLIGLPVVNGWPQIYNSFPVSLIWLTIGKIIAENKGRVCSWKYTILIISAVLYIAEYVTCIRFDWANNTDSLITMIPVCSAIFMIIVDSSVNIGNQGRFLREISTVSYCLHASVGVVLGVVFKLLFKANMESGVWMATRYASTVLICVTATMAIKRLERHVKIARWLY